MKFPIVLGMVSALLLGAAAAHAYPDKGTCAGCHFDNPAVTVSATFQGCSGGNAVYSVAVSTTYEQAEAWAVFSGSANVANGNAPGTFSVPSGATYTLYGVSDSDLSATGGKGGSDSIVLSPTCASACTDADRDGYALQGGSCGPVDCNDANAAVNPGAAESCVNEIDDDCDGLVDAQDPNAVNCPPSCTDADNDGYALEGGDCGQADCNDASLAIHPGAVENCTNGLDDDCDTKVDSADTDCGACVPTAKWETRRKCTNGLDDDCDGKVDAADPDCAAPVAENCTDGIDNDGDRKIDCADRDCRQDPSCIR